MSLWLDDLRPAPEGWCWVKTVDEAITVLSRTNVSQASLDNDLGENVPEGRKLVLWMAEHDTWPSQRLEVHSVNPVAAQAMAGLIERYGPYSRIPASRPIFERCR